MLKYNLFSKNKLRIFDIYRIPFHYCPFYTVLIGLVNFLNGLIPTLFLLSTTRFINSSIRLLEGSNKTHIIISAIVMILCISYTSLSSLLMKYLSTKLRINLKEKFTPQLIERIGSLKYDYLENDTSLDLISRITREPENQCAKSYGDVLGALSLLLKILGIMGVFFFKLPWATITIILIALPTFIIAIRAGEENYQANREAEKHLRRVDYLSELLIGRKTTKERNLFNYSKKINDIWYEEHQKARKIKLRASLKWLKGSEVSGLLTSLLIGVVILILVFPLKRGLISLGIFISVTNSIIALIPDLAWQLPDYTESIAQAKAYLDDFSKLLSLEYKKEYLSRPAKKPLEIETIEFRNVSFRYPGRGRYVLKNLNLVIEKGKHYALVGINGSGKTTITKLVTGLYEDFEGDVLINKISIKEYRQEELKSMFSLVYQDFARYGISLRENIEIGNVNQTSKQRLREAVEESGLTHLVNSLPNGLDSPIGKILKDSVDLSGGQWQRVAIARALFSEGSLRILDEPTSALDPVSESQLYEKFKEISNSNTTLFISHRLASTKFADLIYVIEDGAISEKGNFQELMEKNGSYAQMFKSQRRWYEDEN